MAGEVTGLTAEIRGHAHLEFVAELHVHDDRLDEDLGVQLVHLGHDVGDHLHVLTVGEDDERIRAFVGHNAGILEQLDLLLAAGGAVDDLLQTLAEGGGTGAGSGGAGRCLHGPVGSGLVKRGRIQGGGLRAEDLLRSVRPTGRDC